MDCRDAAVDKSTAFLECEPLFAQSRVELLDHPQLVRELKILERRPHGGGRTVVDHPRGGSDDYANAFCLAAAQTISQAASVRPASGRVPPGPVAGVDLGHAWRGWERW